MAKGLKWNEFLCDIHVPELLVFAAGTNLHEHELYKSGSIILQDKVSSLVAMLSFDIHITVCIPSLTCNSAMYTRNSLI